MRNPLRRKPGCQHLWMTLTVRHGTDWDGTVTEASQKCDNCGKLRTRMIRGYFHIDTLNEEANAELAKKGYQLVSRKRGTACQPASSAR